MSVPVSMIKGATLEDRVKNLFDYGHVIDIRDYSIRQATIKTVVEFIRQEHRIAWSAGAAGVPVEDL